MKPMIRLLSISALVLAGLIAAIYFALPAPQQSISFEEVGPGRSSPQTADSSATLAAPVLVASPGSDRITISWAPIVGAASYEIWARQGELPWERLDDDGSLSHNMTSFTHTGLTSGDSYKYTGRAAPVAGELSDWSAEVEATVSYVPALTAAASAGRIELGWTSVAGADSYQIIMWTDGLKDWDRIGDPITGAITSYTHTGLTELNTYHYRVRAVVDGTEEDWSDSVSEIPVRPAAPATLTATAATGQVELEWSAVPDADSYRLISWTDGQTAWQRIGDPLSSSTTSYTHTGLIAGRTYYYRVSAVIHGIEGAWTESVSDVPSAPPAPTLTATTAVGQVDLSWSEVTGADSHILIVWTDAQNAWVRIGDPLSGDTTSYTHSGLSAGQTYYYRVGAVVDGTEGAWSNSPSAVPGATFMPGLVANASANGIDLSWSEVTDADSYQLIVWTPGQTEWERIGGTHSAGTTSHTHTGLTAGSTYYYRVRAVIDGTEGPWSEEVDAVP